MKHFFLALVSLFITLNAFGQGCSDAGFCTMGAMRPDQPFNKGIKIKLRSIELNQYRGSTKPISALLYVTSLDFNFSINQKTSFQVKVPYQISQGNFGTLSGLGDLSLSASRNVYSSDKFDINATIGTKIPTNDANQTANKSDFDAKELPLPMYYQTSLGSVDLIAGAALMNKKWLFAIGYQAALTANGNEFDTLSWQAVYHTDEYVSDHNLATKLKRGTDVMLRIERNFRYDRFNFYVGALPIIRITKDQVEVVDKYESVDGTTGLAFTLLAGGGYHFNANSSIKITYGQKIKDREVNPDGLTRHSVAAIGYVYKF